MSGIKKAEIECKMFHLKKVVAAKHWTASAWMLERKWPEEFGRKITVEDRSLPGDNPRTNITGELALGEEIKPAEDASVSK